MKIRKAKQSDLPEIARQDVRIFKDTTVSKALSHYSAVFKRRIEGGFLVAEESGKIIGAIAAGKENTIFGKEGKIESLFVLENARGKGVGKALVKSVVSSAKKRGIKSISLTVKEENLAARKLYESEGFFQSRIVYKKTLSRN